MKLFAKYILVLSSFTFTVFVASCQDLHKLKEFPIGNAQDNTLPLTDDITITREFDSDFIYYIMKIYQKGELQLIDSIDITPYGTKFRLFELMDKEEMLLVSEIEYEHFSYYPIYLLKPRDFKKIGNLNIVLDCESCDAQNYPIDDIVIRGNQQTIEFSFRKKLLLWDGNELKPVDKDSFRFVYQIGGQLKTID